MLFQFDYKKAMMTYLENKYPDDTFHFINIGTELWNANYVEMIVSSDKFPAPEYYIHVRMDEKSHAITEDYIEFYFREQAIAHVKPFVENIYGASHISCGIAGTSLFPSRLSADMDVSEYLRDVKNAQGCSLDFSIYTTKDLATKEEDIELLRQALATREFKVDLGILYVKELNDHLDKMNGIQGRQWMRENCSLIGSFHMNESYQFNFREWREYN